MKRISLENVDIVDIKKKTLTQLDSLYCFTRFHGIKSQWYRIGNTEIISILAKKNVKKLISRVFLSPDFFRKDANQISIEQEPLQCLQKRHICILVILNT